MTNQDKPRGYKTISIEALKRWLSVLGWMSLTFLVSTDFMSAAHTIKYVGPILCWIKPDVSWGTIQRVHLIVRKMAHVTEYAILTVLLFRAIRDSRRSPYRLLDWKTPFAAFVIAAMYAAGDEFHQTFVPSRVGCVTDVLIDMMGALLGLFIITGAGYLGAHVFVSGGQGKLILKGGPCLSDKL